MTRADVLHARALEVADGLSAGIARHRDPRDLARDAQRLRDLLIEYAVVDPPASSARPQ